MVGYWLDMRGEKRLIVTEDENIAIEGRDEEMEFPLEVKDLLRTLQILYRFMAGSVTFPNDSFCHFIPNYSNNIFMCKLLKFNSIHIPIPS